MSLSINSEPSLNYSKCLTILTNEDSNPNYYLINFPYSTSFNAEYILLVIVFLL